MRLRIAAASPSSPWRPAPSPSLAFAPLASAKEASKFFGTEAGTGFFGGEFDFGGPGFDGGGLAVNNTGTGAPQGTIYVADGDNNRVQRFDADNRFVSAWGKDVIAATVNESQRLAIDATGGTYTLSFDGATTAPIAFNANAPPFDNALDALSSIGGDANVTSLRRRHRHQPLHHHLHRRPRRHRPAPDHRRRLEPRRHRQSHHRRRRRPRGRQRHRHGL